VVSELVITNYLLHKCSYIYLSSVKLVIMIMTNSMVVVTVDVAVAVAIRRWAQRQRTGMAFCSLIR